MSSYIKVDGSLFVQATEGGDSTQSIPMEIYTDYSEDPTNTDFRQLKFPGFTYMGVSNVGSYFYISKPSITNVTKSFIITANSNVGIGTIEPTHILHVEGEALIRNSLYTTTSANISANIHTSNVVIGDGKLVVGINPNHRIPAGTIALWENASTIPAGWSKFQPDSFGTRFIRGSATTGSTGGTSNVSINSSNFPTHNHTVNNANFANTTHTHVVNADMANSNATHGHTLSVNTTSANHTHDITDRNRKFGTGNNYNITAYRIEPSGWKNSYAYTPELVRFPDSSTADAHSHAFTSGTIANSQMTHQHSITPVPNSSVKSWTHASPSVNLGNTGTNITSQDIIPKYKSYVFIVKQ